MVENLATENENYIPYFKKTDIAATLMARDYKGLRNYSCNAIIEIYEVTNGTDSMQNGIDSPGNNERIGSVQNGGGGRLELSRLQNKARSSNRERRDLPDSDNGEYP